MPLLKLPFGSSHNPQESSSRGSSEATPSGSKWTLLRQSVRRPTLSPLPRTITDQISTEIYELIIDHLDHTPSLLACNLVCRSWTPRSKCLLLERMICRPVPLVAHGGFGPISCAVPDPLRGNGAVIYGTKDGIYRGTKDGSRPRLLSIRDVSQIDILSHENLVICLAGGNFMTMPLSALTSGACHDSAITRISKHVSCFTVYRSTVAGERHRLCALKGSTLSGTLKVYDVTGTNTFTLVSARELYIPLETYSVRFLSHTKLVAALRKGFAVEGGFEMVDLITLETQSLIDPDDPCHLEFSLKKAKPLAVFRVDAAFIVCYDKLAFYLDRRGNRTRNELAMRWTQPANAFALHEPYILAFCDMRVEVWNIETGAMVQKISGPYHLLNTPDSGEKVLGLSLLSGEIAEIVFREDAVPSS
ncbi:CNH domain-containing protein [Mycena galopus ATCC 62051]|nr:CNH domain-containing protein [Mycena galopus ATCC 62051]